MKHWFYDRHTLPLSLFIWLVCLVFCFLFGLAFHRPAGCKEKQHPVVLQLFLKEKIDKRIIRLSTENAPDGVDHLSSQYFPALAPRVYAIQSEHIHPREYRISYATAVVSLSLYCAILLYWPLSYTQFLCFSLSLSDLFSLFIRESITKKSSFY